MEPQYEQIVQKFKDLTDQLADDTVLKDPKRYNEIAKERAELEEAVKLIHELEEITKTIANDRTVIEAGEDDELVALATGEVEELETREDNLTRRLKVLLAPKDPNDSKNTIIEKILDLKQNVYHSIS